MGLFSNKGGFVGSQTIKLRKVLILHSREFFRRWRGTFFCLAKRKSRKEKATHVAAKARSILPAQGDEVTRSVLPRLTQTPLVLKPWSRKFDRLAT
ncbi:hypothetical protein [Alishewanella sp. HL-SH06]|uniref:hypothetical protein n=1 Tax=Alishewanella sp. HL-SH06 TaxID=3461144 RepID=UPI0040418CC3